MKVKQCTNAKFKYAFPFVEKKREHDEELTQWEKSYKIMTCTCFWKYIKVMNSCKMSFLSEIKSVYSLERIAEVWHEHYSNLFNCGKSENFVIEHVDV